MGNIEQVKEILSEVFNGGWFTTKSEEDNYFDKKAAEIDSLYTSEASPEQATEQRFTMIRDGCEYPIACYKGEHYYIADRKRFGEPFEKCSGEHLDFGDVSPTPQIAKPKIVCLCGSTRFVDTFNEWRKKLTYEGKIVLSIEIVTSQAKKDDPQFVKPEMKKQLDELHLRKIDLADEVMILNVDGYIGESTNRELEYARQHGKTVKFLEPHS